MSRVTNAILTFSLREDEHDRLAEVNKYFEQPNVHPQRGFVHVESMCEGTWVGGCKALETNICIGAFNYLSHTDLMKWLKFHVHWNAPEYVQLIIQEQEEDVFRIINLEAQL